MRRPRITKHVVDVSRLLKLTPYWKYKYAGIYFGGQWSIGILWRVRAAKKH